MDKQRKRKPTKSKQPAKRQAKKRNRSSNVKGNKRSKVANKSTGKTAADENADDLVQADSVAAKHGVPLVVERMRHIGPVVRIKAQDGNNIARFHYSVINKFPSKDQELKGKQPSANQFSQNSTNWGSRNKKVSDRRLLSQPGTVDWQCSLCHRKALADSLGDLYGPYYIETPIAISLPAKTTKRSRKKSTAPKRETINKTQLQSASSLSTEVWLHEDCTVWTSGLFLQSGALPNLSTVIEESSQLQCVCCSVPGATMSCLQRHCAYNALHYPCAKELGCHFDENKFAIYCPTHKASQLSAHILPPYPPIY